MQLRQGNTSSHVKLDWTRTVHTTYVLRQEVCRPHLHKFLASAYEDYDIVIWSANSLKWMNVKMKALGVLTHSDFKITFMMDYKSMLTLHTERYGVHAAGCLTCAGRLALDESSFALTRRAP